MKQNLIVALAFLLFLNSQALISQTLPTNTDYYKKKELHIDLDEFVGSKYLNEDFEKGVIVDDLTNKNFGAFLRYDILNDVFEIKERLSQSSNTFLKKALATSIQFRNSLFVFTSFPNENGNTEIGYLQELGTADYGKIYVRHFADIRLPEKAKTSLEKDRKGRISQKAYFLIKKEDVLEPFEVDRKSILEVFSEPKHDTIRFFLKKNRNKLRSIDDLVSLLNFTNTL